MQMQSLKSSDATVILIVGSPHGGTTITSLLLGQHRDVFIAGDLRNFPQRGEWMDLRTCACNKPHAECEFWQDISTQYAEFDGLAENERLKRLYGIISKTSGRRYIVDVVHEAERLTELTNIDGLDLRLIHLVRDGRAVVNSRLKLDYLKKNLSSYGWQHFRRVVKNTRRWQERFHQAAEIERRLGGRAIRVRYEDICLDPDNTLNRLGRFLGLDLEAIVAHISAGRPLQRIPHLWRGNAKLMSQEGTVLQYDDRFRREMSFVDQCMFHIFSGFQTLRM